MQQKDTQPSADPVLQGGCNRQPTEGPTYVISDGDFGLDIEPQLSVIVPAYDGAATLEDCLRSIRASEGVVFELIVVDDGSRDASTSIALRHANLVIEHRENQGRHAARCNGFSRASSSILVNVDQDVLLPPTALAQIAKYLAAAPATAAVTGRLAADHPVREFFSEYKNLYMNHMFGQLSEHVEFLYGSIFAIRRDAFERCNLRGVDFAAHDTAWGLQLARQGCQIALLQDLEVTHLKRYSSRSLIENDFLIPYNWAKIYVAFSMWRELPRLAHPQAGFAHASRRQLGTLLATALVAMALLWLVVSPGSLSLAAVLFALAVWWWLNSPLLLFIKGRKGDWFAIRAAVFGLFDNFVMGCGLFFGLMQALMNRNGSIPS